MGVYASNLNARFVDCMKQHTLRAEIQTGFRPELATTHQLLEMQHFVSESQYARTPLCACFEDLKRRLRQDSAIRSAADFAKAGAA